MLYLLKARAQRCTLLGCLPQPDKLDKCLDAYAQLLDVLLVVIAFKADNGYAELSKLLLDTLVLKVVNKAAAQNVVDNSLYVIVLDKLPQAVQPLLVVGKGRTGTGAQGAVGKRSYHSVEAVVGDDGRVIHTALAHTGLVSCDYAAHFLDKKRYL